MTINDYVLLAKDNDVLAIEKLIKQFRGTMNSIKGIYKYVPEDEKETLCMIGFMKAIRKFNVDDKRCIFHTYLYTVVNNEFKMFIKSLNTKKNSIQTVSIQQLVEETGVKYETDLYYLVDDNFENEIIETTDLSICVNKALDIIKDEQMKLALIDVMYNEYNMVDASKKNNVKYRKLKKSFYECRDLIKELYRGSSNE